MLQLKQLITGLFTLGLLLWKRFRDGVQPATDFLGLISDLLADEQARAELEIGFEGADQIDDEIRGAGWREWFDVFEHVMTEVKEFLGAIGAPEPRDLPE